MNWTDQAVSTLHSSWADGHSTAEIGRRMGITKNAVAGKAHRLKLAGRPSPMGSKPSTVAKIKRGTQRSGRSRETRPVVAAAALSPAPPTSPAPARVAARPAPLALSSRACCQWPIGEPGSAGFHLCDEPALASRPYCEAHCRKAYVRPTRVLALAGFGPGERP